MMTGLQRDLDWDVNQCTCAELAEKIPMKGSCPKAPLSVVALGSNCLAPILRHPGWVGRDPPGDLFINANNTPWPTLAFTPIRYDSHAYKFHFHAMHFLQTVPVLYDMDMVISSFVNVSETVVFLYQNIINVRHTCCCRYVWTYCCGESEAETEVETLTQFQSPFSTTKTLVGRGNLFSTSRHSKA